MRKTRSRFWHEWNGSTRIAEGVISCVNGHESCPARRLGMPLRSQSIDGIGARSFVALCVGTAASRCSAQAGPISAQRLINGCKPASLRCGINGRGAALRPCRPTPFRLEGLSSGTSLILSTDRACASRHAINGGETLKKKFYRVTGKRAGANFFAAFLGVDFT